jgi:16S rRNA (cytosine1402-N4)-methyltransferase
MSSVAMMSAADAPRGHEPVLRDEMLAALAVRADGVYLDATFGVGGYSRAILAAGAGRVLAIDRDPAAVARGRELARVQPRFTMIEGCFGDAAALLDACGVTRLDGAVFDLGVCSTQLEDGARGFSFTRDGPLDMRMSGDGLSAADVVNQTDEAALASILYRYGEERASRRIARAIVAARPIDTTAVLAATVERCLPRAKPGQSHPATRTFQAIRIAVNDEFGELARGLEAAERALAPGGALAVVTFHSIEDRAVKRYFLSGTGRAGRANRYAPEAAAEAPRYYDASRAVAPDEDELAQNPRARSARLRVAWRSDALALPVDRAALGLPETGGAR